MHMETNSTSVRFFYLQVSMECKMNEWMNKWTPWTRRWKHYNLSKCWRLLIRQWHIYSRSENCNTVKLCCGCGCGYAMLSAAHRSTHVHMICECAMLSAAHRSTHVHMLICGCAMLSAAHRSIHVHMLIGGCAVLSAAHRSTRAYPNLWIIKTLPCVIQNMWLNINHVQSKSVKIGIIALSEHRQGWLCIIRAHVGLTLHYQRTGETDCTIRTQVAPTALSEHRWDWCCIVRARVGLTLHYQSTGGTTFAFSSQEVLC
jgi:hypothetical protein